MTASEPDDRQDLKDAAGNARQTAAGEFEDILAGMQGGEAPQLVSTAFRNTLDRMAMTYRSYIPAGLLSRLYADEAPSRAQLREVPRSDQEAVAAELGLGPSMTADELRRIRREFALTNHPDRVVPARRPHATRRMTIANSLIDKALAERQGSVC